MPEEIVPQNTLRDALESSFEAAETDTLPTPQERARDEAGRFAQKPQEVAAPETKPEVRPEVPPQAAWAGPSTWKKEYRPLYDKLASGQPLNANEAKKLAQYTNERENDFKTGVSTYKSEAMAAKELQEAITPFLPELKANGMNPGQWIRQLGQAHYALAKGAPELKLQVFRELARQFGVPLGAVMQNQQQVPPIVNDLLGQIQQLKEQVSGVASWRQQQEQSTLTGEIAKLANDKENYPHFEAVRQTMAQLLESGLAPDLPSAYKKAVWMQDDVREANLQGLQRPNPVLTARTRAVSPRSATPSGQVATSGAKDRRAALEDAFDQLGGGRV